MDAILVERHTSIQLRPITERLLHAAGIRRGMHVLDLDCGCGDISLLAAEMVGPNGLILGVDRDSSRLETARHRAWRADFDHVYFLEAGIEDLREEGPFDAVIARNLLSHADDPVAAVRRAAQLLRHGGLIALHESSADVMRILMQAGLAGQELFAETVGGDPQYCAWAHKI
jgi:ubiquinone/menaquinone biosynthesis C-methylase UbiE